MFKVHPALATPWQCQQESHLGPWGAFSLCVYMYSGVAVHNTSTGQSEVSRKMGTAAIAALTDQVELAEPGEDSV